MNQPLRDLLRQGADSVGRPQLDVAQLVGQAERKLFRRRVATVAASAVAVAGIVAGGVALGSHEDRLSPAPPVKTPETPQPLPDDGATTYFAAPPDEAGDPLRGWFVEIGGESDLGSRGDVQTESARRRCVATGDQQPGAGRRLRLSLSPRGTCSWATGF